MTVHKFKTCKCTHGADQHEVVPGSKKRGRCLYGHDRNIIGTAIAGCTCQCFHRRASPSAYIEDPALVLAVGEPEVVGAIDDIIRGFQRLRAALPVYGAPRPLLPLATAPVRVSVAKSAVRSEMETKPPKVKSTRALGDGELHFPPGAQRMLDVLASYPDGALTRIQLGTLSVCPAKKGTFRTYYGLLKRHKLACDIAENHVQLLPAGHRRATPGRPLTRTDIVAMWTPRLAPGMRSILDAVVGHGGPPLSREQVGERSKIDPKGGTWRTYFGKLKSDQLLVLRGNMVGLGEALACASAGTSVFGGGRTR